MRVLVNVFWRSVYRLGYPCAQVVWQITGKSGCGAAIAVWHDGRLLCVRHSYRPRLCLPGGGLMPDEEPAEAARRELREEVGLDLAADLFRERPALDYAFGRRRIRDSLFEIHLTEPLEPLVDEREIIWAGYLTPAEIRRADMQRSMRLYLERAGDRAGQP